ncbi:putative F-box protein At3g16210 [Brachypodium distachyon]|uniref:F-box domain-containing protein n=1 Tax=Brachypodium distachyon TaxID=15368 RepID=A0A0Q3F014_BRADI|nr:putative F-box protein At3g16210 [Brachypodium distachyon]KQJ93023.1 hypothetical protein BRADI_3g02257v3 [Brachypodium distachyon]|eukprot:XP_003573684.1 putative F-box protein At3g16210 [Brachypodium distachyon]
MTSLRSPLDVDDLLSEILLRLPPQPSSLPRASLVCKRWRRLASDPRFTRRFRLHHRRRNPPLLGLFTDSYDNSPFLPTLDPPNRVPEDRFRLHFDEGDDDFVTLGCHHGLALIHHVSRGQLLVWDPVNGDRHRVHIPPGFANINGAVLRGAAQDFQVVLVGRDDQVLACVYSSETGAWGNPISALLECSSMICRFTPGLVVGDSIYWSFTDSSAGILEFDLGRQSLVAIPLPEGVIGPRFMRAEDGGPGFIFKNDCTIKIWKRKTDSGGVASSWMLGRTIIELDKVLPMETLEEGRPLVPLGFAVENNVVVLGTVFGLYLLQIESLECKMIMESYYLQNYHPFESVYTGETCIGSGNEGAELLLGA